LFLYGNLITLFQTLCVVGLIIASNDDDDDDDDDDPMDEKEEEEKEEEEEEEKGKKHPPADPMDESRDAKRHREVTATTPVVQVVGAPNEESAKRLLSARNRSNTDVLMEGRRSVWDEDYFNLDELIEEMENDKLIDSFEVDLDL
jgi:hypothetical protein